MKLWCNFILKRKKVHMYSAFELQINNVTKRHIFHNKSTFVNTKIQHNIHQTKLHIIFICKPNYVMILYEYLLLLTMICFT